MADRDDEGKETPSNSVQGVGTHVAPTGFGAAPVPSLNIAIRRVLELLYAGIPLPEKPVTVKHVAKAHRNAEIRARYAAGEILEELAAEYGISHQRIHQIIHSRQR